MRVAMIGLGKLGLPVAYAMGSRGIEVFGHDPNVWAPPEDLSHEADLQRLVEDEFVNGPTRVHFCELVDAVNNTDGVVFVAVQTPHEPRFEGVTPLPEDRADFDYTHLKKAVQQVAHTAVAIRKDVTIAIISTVLPGTIEREIEPLLPSGIRCVYSPSFIAMGTTIRDFLDPEFVLLGGDDEGNARAVYEEIGALPEERMVLPGYPRGIDMSIRDAELTKVAYNTFIGLKIAFANTLMEICHKTGGDVDQVTGALKLAHRRLISPAYLDGGMGDGGGCFPPGELVMTEHGPRPIETIQRGDRVLAGDGVLRKVVHHWERHYEGDLARVTVEGMPPVLATTDHPFYVATDGRPPGAGRKHHSVRGPIAHHLGPLHKKQAEDLADDDFVGWTRVLEDLTVEVPDHVAFDYLELAGWYLAEGSIDSKTTGLGNPRSARISFDLHASEVEERERIAELLVGLAPPKIEGRGAGAVVSTTVKDNRATVRYGSLELAQLLQADFGKGCADKILPAWLLWGPLENAAVVLRGMILGDGHISEDGIHYATTSRDLAYGAAMLIERLGFAPTLRTADRPDRLRQYEMRVRNGPDARGLAAALDLPGPTAPGKGAERFPDRADGHFYRRIRKVERIPYSGPVHNLWVEEEHSYVTSAGRVANCHPRDNIALSWLARELDLSYDLFESAMTAREEQARWLIYQMEGWGDLPMGVLGIAYKPGSHITTGSAALLAKHYLEREGHEVGVYDPHVPVGPGLQADLKAPHVWLVGCKHPEFVDLKLPEGSIVIDPFRYIPDQEGVTVVRLGEAAGRRGRLHTPVEGSEAVGSEAA
jgi:UDP-glucose 6-dehydrogenase